MPHLHIEYSPGLEKRVDMKAVCESAHRAMQSSGIFPLAGIRVRAFAADYCIVADGLEDNDFAALTLSVGAGRSTEQLQAAGAQIFTAVKNALETPLSTPYFALSLEIRVIDAQLSWKETPIHARLSGE